MGDRPAWQLRTRVTRRCRIAEGRGILTAFRQPVWLLFVKQVSHFMLRRRDWCVRDAPSCPPHSASEPSDSRLKQWALAEVPRRGSCVVGIPLVLWCLLWSLLDLAKYMAGRSWYNPSSQYPTMPPWDGSASLFPQASDVGRTGCWPLANRISSRAAGSSISAIGGVALPMALRFMGRRSTRSRWWSCPLRLSSVDVFVLNRAAVPQSLHLMNDLAGTMQPELLPIGRTPLGKSRGFIHDLNLSFSRSTLLAEDGLTDSTSRLMHDLQQIIGVLAVVDCIRVSSHSGNTRGSVKASAASSELHPVSRFYSETCRVVVFPFS